MEPLPAPRTGPQLRETTGLLSIRSTDVTDADCGGEAYTEQVLQEDELEVPSLPVEEGVRVVLGAGKQRDCSCESGELEP